MIRYNDATTPPQLSEGLLFALHLACLLLPDSPRYPDLKSYAFTVFGFVHFFSVWAACNVLQFITPKTDEAHRRAKAD